MFRGHHPTRVDEKGRLKVPAEYKREIDEKYGAQFYITSTDGKIAQVYPLEVWEAREQKLLAHALNPHVKKYLTATSFYGQVAEMDGQGRLLLPALLREKAALKGDVSVLGALQYLEIRVLEDLSKQVETNPVTPEDEEALAQLGIQ